MIEAKQASISIFLSVIFLSLIILSCSIVDLSRYYIGKVQGQRAVNLAHQSVMAGFDSQLALQYGVFGYPKSESTLDELAMYVREGLSPGSVWNNYRFDNKQIVSSQPMLNTAYLKDQITQYMKYRGPYLGIEALLGKLEFFEKGSKTGEIIAKDNEVAERVDGLTANYHELEKVIDGIQMTENGVIQSDGVADISDNFLKMWAPGGGMNVFGFPDQALTAHVESLVIDLSQVLSDTTYNMDAGFNMAEQFMYHVDRYLSYEDDYIRLNDEIDAIRYELSLLDTETDIVQIESLKARILDLEKARFHALDAMTMEENAMTDCATQINIHYTKVQEGQKQVLIPIIGNTTGDNLLSTHTYGQVLIAEIIAANRDLETLVSDLEQTLADNRPLYIEDVSASIDDHIEAYNEFIGTDHESEFYHIQEVIDANHMILVDTTPLAEALNETISDLPGGWFSMSTTSEQYQKQAEVIRRYFSSISLSASNHDSTMDQLQTLQNNLSGYRTDILLEYGEIVYDDFHMDFSETKSMLEACFHISIPALDDVILESGLPSESASGFDFGGFEIPSALGLGESIGLYNWVTGIYDMFKSASNGFLEDIYISEYIMHMFNHAVTEKKDEVSGEASTAINNLPLNQHKYDGEIEYIIFGNKILKVNIAAAIGVIFVLRVIFNGLHITSSPAKMKVLTDLAVAIAGWWTLGIGTLPIMIALGFIWACLESATDIVELLDGKKVPLFKTEANWNTDLDGLLGMGTDVEDTVTEAADGFSMAYEDYLRLMLYLPFTSEEKKLLRIMDLAQINISHERGERVDFNQYIYDLEVQGDITVNPLFLQLPFMPSGIISLFDGQSHEVNGYYCYQ